MRRQTWARPKAPSAIDGDQPAAILELLEQLLGDLRHGAVEQDGVEGRVRGRAVLQRASITMALATPSWRSVSAARAASASSTSSATTALASRASTAVE